MCNYSQTFGSSRLGAALAAAAMLSVLSPTDLRSQTTFSWGFDAGGSWSDSSASAGWNASGAYPNAIGSIANLSRDITAARIVSIDVSDAIVGTLNLNDTGGSGDVAWTIATTDASVNKLTFEAASGNAILTSAGVTNGISAPIVLNSSVDITTTNGLNLSGIISGTGGLTKAGTGQTLTLSGTGANTYTGMTTVNSGTLSLAKSSGVNAIAGDLTINGGTVSSATNTHQIDDGATVTINGGTLSLDRSETISSLVMTAGNLGMAQAAPNPTAIIITTSTTLSGGTIMPTTGNPKSISFGALSMSGGVINPNQVNGTGQTNMSAASLAITNIAAGAYTPITLKVNSTAASQFTLAGNLTFNRDPANVNSNPVTIDQSGSGSAVPSFALGAAATHEFDIEDGQAADDLIIKPRVTGTNANLVKSGAGTLRLDGTGTYSGTTTVRNGTLVAGTNAPTGAAGAFGNSSSAIILADASSGVNDNIGLLTNGAFTIGRSITVNSNNSGGTTTIGATNGASTTAAFSGAITLNRDVILGAAIANATTDFQGLIDDGGGTSAISTSGSGIVSLSRAAGNTYDGGTVVGAGNTLVVANTSNSATGTGAVNLSAGAGLRGGSGSAIAGVVNLSGNNSVSSSAGTMSVGGLVVAGSGNSISGGTVAGNATIDTGSSLTIANGATLNGNATASGTLAVNTTGAITGNVTVDNGGSFVFNGSTPYSGTLNLINGKLAGTGAFNTGLTLDSLNDVLSPGNSPGIQPFGTSQSWDSFTYEWETNDFSGTTAGTDFDQIQITGGLALNISGNYELTLHSLDAFNAPGNVPNFSETNQSWTILTTTAGISNFNSSLWTIDTSGFTSSPSFAGTFSLSTSGTDLILTYAVPEPSAAILLAGALVSICFRRRRA